MSLMQSHVFTPGKLEDIVTLITGDKSTAHIFKMYHRLLTYCEAFERNEEFKTQMNPPYGFEKSILPPSQEDLLNDTRTRHPRFQFRTSLFDRLDPDSERYRDLLTLNPFKCKPAHPVERELSQCSMASEDNVWSQFVHSRKLIIEYLEPQCKSSPHTPCRIPEHMLTPNSRPAYCSREYPSQGVREGDEAVWWPPFIHPAFTPPYCAKQRSFACAPRLCARTPRTRPGSASRIRCFLQS